MGGGALRRENICVIDIEEYIKINKWKLKSKINKWVLKISNKGENVRWEKSNKD